MKSLTLTLFLVISLVTQSCFFNKEKKEAVEVERGAPAELSLQLESEEVALGEGQSNINFGEVRLNNKVFKNLIITHSGRLPALDIKMPELNPIDEDAFYYKGEGEYPGEGGTCGRRLENGESCIVALEFFPSSEGLSTRNFKIEYNNGIEGGYGTTLNLSGVAGIPAVLEIDEGKTKHEFGLIRPLTEKSVTLTLSNKGGLTARNIQNTITTQDNIAFLGGSYPGEGGTCADSLGFGESCTLVLNFYPDEEGASQGKLTLMYEFFSTFKSNELTLTGSAYYPRADLIFQSSGNFEFEDQIWENSQSTTFFVKNVGYGRGTIEDLSFAGSSTGFEIVTDDPLNPTTCEAGEELEINDTCTIRVRFRPPYLNETAIDNGNGGSYESEIQLSYFNGEFSVEDPITKDLSGGGIVPASLYLTYAGLPTEYFNYGATGIFQEVTRTFTLENKGRSLGRNIDLILNNMLEYSLTPGPDEVSDICETLHDDALADSGNAQGLEVTDPPDCYTGFILNSSDCSNTLSPGQTCNVRISFLARDSSFHILSDDPTFQDVDGQEPFPLLGLKPFRINYFDGAQDQQVKLHLKGFGEGRPVIEWFPRGLNKDSSLIYQFPGSYLERSEYIAEDSPIEGHRNENRVVLWVKNIGTDPALNMSLDAPFGTIPNAAKGFRFTPGQEPFVDDNDLEDFVDGQLCPKNIPSRGECYVAFELYRPDNGFVTDNMEVTYVQTTQTPPTFQGVGQVTTEGIKVFLDAPNTFGEVASAGNPTIEPGDEILVNGQRRYVRNIINDTELSVYNSFSPEVVTPSGFDYIASNTLYSARLNYSARVRSLGRITASDLNFGELAVGAQRTRALELRNSGEIPAQDVSIEWVDDLGDEFSTPSYPAFDSRTELNKTYRDCRDDNTNRGDSFGEFQYRRRCNIPLRYIPEDLGSDTVTLRLTYFDGLFSDATSEFTVRGTGADIANMILQTQGESREESPSPNTTIFKIEDTIIGNTGLYYWHIRNNGTEPATEIIFGGLDERFTIDPDDGETTCEGTVGSRDFEIESLAPGEDCVVALRFNDTDNGLRQALIGYSFFNGSNYTFNNYTVQVNSTTPGLLEIKPINYDFGRVIIDETRNKVFQVTNVGDTSVDVGADVVALSQEDPYEITSNNCNSTTLQRNHTCNLTVRFSPLDIGVEHTANLSIDYYNGVQNTSSSSSIMGLSAPPNSTHLGWDEIYAEGDDYDVADVRNNVKKVKLAWPHMNPPAGYSFDHYNIYKASSAASIDLETPLNPSPISVSNREFVDTSVSSGETYYYRVQPIIQGAVSQTTELFTNVKVTIPPDNMVLVHRWMANKNICENMGETPNKNSNFRCNYEGPGATGAYFDMGYDFLVDKYELGRETDDNRPGQQPHDSLTQSEAWDMCQSSSAQLATGSKQKRLPRRKEFLVAAAWSKSLEDASESVLRSLEEGTPTGSYPEPCNGYFSGEGATVPTGSRRDCVSRFGVYDMVGNIQEHTSDLLSGGTHSSQYQLDPNNKDMLGYFLDYDSISERSAKFSSCFNFVMGMPKDEFAGECDESTLLEAQHDKIFHDGDVAMTPQSSPEQLIFAAQNGGSFSSNDYSGRWRVNWTLGIGNTAGARCLVPLN